VMKRICLAPLLSCLVALSGSCIFAAACSENVTARSSARSDYFYLCERANGTYYDVDANKERCPPGEDTFRCKLANSQIIHVSTEKECDQKGGHPFGFRP